MSWSRRDPSAARSVPRGVVKSCQLATVEVCRRLGEPLIPSLSPETEVLLHIPSSLEPAYPDRVCETWRSTHIEPELRRW